MQLEPSRALRRILPHQARPLKQPVASDTRADDSLTAEILQPAMQEGRWILYREASKSVLLAVSCVDVLGGESMAFVELPPNSPVARIPLRGRWVEIEPPSQAEARVVFIRSRQGHCYRLTELGPFDAPERIWLAGSVQQLWSGPLRILGEAWEAELRLGDLRAAPDHRPPRAPRLKRERARRRLRASGLVPFER